VATALNGSRSPPILKFYLEIFDTHHPLGDDYAYEEQKSAAKRRTKSFLAVRLPKFLGYFERVLELNRARGRNRRRLRALHDVVFDRPRIAHYVSSGRRLAFNNEDLFRHYPELDR
jgi:glutathione S-transferase